VPRWLLAVAGCYRVDKAIVRRSASVCWVRWMEWGLGGFGFFRVPMARRLVGADAATPDAAARETSERTRAEVADFVGVGESGI
jgi:hypothetical protein